MLALTQFQYFQIFGGVAIFGIVLSGILFLVSRMREKKELMNSLDFSLYEITLPQNEKQKEGAQQKTFKELIGAMEQFYSGMTAIDPYYVLEVGLPTMGKEVVFYAAVAKKHSQLFQKMAQGLLPHSNISVKKDDYNVFRPEGFSFGSTAKLQKKEILPIKTYDKFDSDPVQVIISTFSKLQEAGEGASLQILVSPADSSLASRTKKVVSELRKGKSLSKAMKGGEGLGMAVLKEFGNIFGSATGLSSDSKKDKEKEDQKNKPVDEELVKLIEAKGAKQIVNVNIRLVSSAESEVKADSVLSELESAFLQFNEAQGNSIKFVRLKGRKLKELFYKFAFRIFDKKSAIKLNTAEIASVFHFPSGIEASFVPNLKSLKTKESAPPANMPRTGVLLGKNIYRGQESDVYMKDDDRRRHFYVIGQTGVGKTVLLKNMIIQDIEQGKGVCFIDPHGSDLQDIISRIPPSRIDDVIYFNPGDMERPMGLNMLEYDPRYPEQKTFIVNELLGIFNKLFDMKVAGGPMFEQYFRNSALLVMDSPSLGNTLLEIQRVLADADFRNKKLELCNNPIVKSFWQDVAEKTGGEHALQNMVPWITSKFDNFLSNDIMRPIIAQEKSAFNFREVMDDGKIFLVNLSKGRLGDINSHLIGLIIVGKMLMASLSRVDIPEDDRKDFYLYVDEFQNVTTDSISTILSEARKYKLNLIIAHQFIGQLEDNIKKAVFGNVGSLAAFRVGPDDTEILEKQFEPVFNAYDLMNIDNRNACVRLLIDGQTARPFNLKTIQFKKGEKAFTDEVTKLSSLKYGRPREEVEAEIRRRYNA